MSVKGTTSRALNTMAGGCLLLCFVTLAPHDLSASEPSHCDGLRQTGEHRSSGSVQTEFLDCGRIVEVASSHCVRHEDLDTHSGGHAVDIDMVGGNVSAENEHAKQIQIVIHDDPNVVENFGPFMQERRNADGAWTKVVVCPGEFQDFIHFSVAP